MFVEYNQISAKALSVEEILNRNFDRMVILCRETIEGISWSVVLETLRIWEYTSLVRRGYFIEGLSGIQFIRQNDYERTMIKLQQPYTQVVWLNAIDSMQPWGKYLEHLSKKVSKCGWNTGGISCSVDKIKSLGYKEPFISFLEE